MPLYKPRFLLLFLFLLANVKVLAQAGGASLGDPVVQEDFGSGSDPHYPNSTYLRVGGSCPSPGYYAISKTESGCHDTWHTVLKDHTGNDGYMMIIDAAVDAGEFYKQQTPPLLCGGTKYEFSVYVKNLVLPAYANTHSKPDLTFRIEDIDGNLVAPPISTGPIYETAGADDWQRVAQVITLPGNVNAVVVKIINNGTGQIGNDLILDDIAFRAYGAVVQAGFAGSANVTEHDVCEGDPYQYDLTSTPVTDYSTPRYQWQVNTGSGWADLNGETNTTLHIEKTNAIPGLYQYRLGVAEGDNITSLNCRVFTNIVNLRVNSNPVIPVIPPQQPCESETLTLTASGGVSYIWTLPDGTQRSENPLVIANIMLTQSGPYTVKAISAANCSATQTVQVTVKPVPVITVSGPQSICQGVSVNLSASAAGAASYSWLPVTGLSNPNSATPTASPDVSTLYTVTVTSTNGCVSEKTVQVDVTPLPLVNAGKDLKIFEGQSTQLTGTVSGDIQSYSWSPADYLDDPTSLMPIATPLHDITYTLTVTSANGCGNNQSSVFIRVYNKIVIPTSFTPNNDGVNDLWNIEALDTYGDGTIAVYDRRGKQVYFSKGYGKPWDGRQNGNPLPAGTYYYVIDLKNGTRNQSGWVLLMR